MHSVRWILATSVTLMGWLPVQSAWSQQTTQAVQAPTAQLATPASPAGDTARTAPEASSNVTGPNTDHPATVSADEHASPAMTGSTSDAQSASPAASTQTADALMGTAVSPTALDGYRGGSQTFNDMQVNGTMSDTRALGVTTGSNSIAEGSFANASGLPMVIQNTGANVLIQNATIVNVQFKQ